MFSIRQELVPQDALLTTYAGGACAGEWRGHADCFSVTVDREVRLADFVFSFYTSPMFRMERLILRGLADAPSSDRDARAVANGFGGSFAIWRVGERTANELLMCDRYERTRSWFRVIPMDGGKTRLQFGSALAAAREERRGALRDGWVRPLFALHVLYSRILLYAAIVRVLDMTAAD
ncbi:MAG: hypothetical protein ABSH33_11680 [Steroidobacteraceae bacterium]|jgi:hypothetical protein